MYYTRVGVLWIGLVLVLSTVARGQTLFASPFGSTTHPTCTDENNPCTFEHAVATVTANNNIVLLGGDYLVADVINDLPNGVQFLSDGSAKIVCVGGGRISGAGWHSWSNVVFSGECTGSYGFFASQSDIQFNACNFSDMTAVVSLTDENFMIFSRDRLNFTDCVFSNINFENSGGFSFIQQGLIYYEGQAVFTNCVFRNNHFINDVSVPSFNMIFGTETSNLYLKNTIFENNTVIMERNDKVYGILIKGYNLYLDQTKFLGNTIDGGEVDGGLIYTTTPVTLNGCEFSYNIITVASLAQGGVINAQDQIQVLHSNFTENIVYGSGYGAAIYVNNIGYPVSVLEYSVFTGNGFFNDNEHRPQFTPHAQGGAVFLNSAPPSIVGCEFHGNFLIPRFTVATIIGGAALFINTFSEFTIEDTIFSNNYITTITTTTFESNLDLPGLSVRGGAFYIYGGTANIFNCSFNNNSVQVDLGGAITYGGTIYTFVSKLNLRNCDFDQNYISSYASIFPQFIQGGAVYVEAEDALIDYCSFNNGFIYTERTTANLGGAVYFSLTTATVRFSNFSNNNIQTISGGSSFLLQVGGGAIYAQNSYVEIYNSIFENNFVKPFDSNPILMESMGGAVGFMLSHGAVFNSNFVNNTVYGVGIEDHLPESGTAQGGAIYVRTLFGNLDIKGCNFIRNSAVSGDIRFMGYTNQYLYYTKNARRGTAGGGAIYGYSLVNVTITDSNFIENNVQGGKLYLDTTPDPDPDGPTDLPPDPSDFSDLPEFPGRRKVRQSDSKSHSNLYYVREILADPLDSGRDQNSVVISADSQGHAIGGAVLAETSYYDNCTFTNNYVTTHTPQKLAIGGGAAIGGQYMIVKNSKFTGNFIENADDASGAAIFAYFTLSVDTSQFERNRVLGPQANGGAISTPVAGTAINYSNSSIYIANSQFTSNNASQGGAIYSDFKTTLRNLHFTNNNADSGASVYAQNGPNLHISALTFSNNTVNGYGSGIASTALSFQILLGNSTVTWPSRTFVVEGFIKDYFDNNVYSPDLFSLAESSDNLFVSGKTNNRAYVNINGVFSFDGMSLRSSSLVPQNITISAPQLSSASPLSKNVYVLNCPPGYYSKDRSCIACLQSEYIVKGSQCIACPTSSTNQATFGCVSPTNSETFTFTIQKGFWPAPSHESFQYLNTCPNKNACKPYVCNISSEYPPTSLDWNIRCDGNRNIANSDPNSDTLCERGYRERMCSRCVCTTGECYFPKDDFSCTRCKNDISIGASVVVFLVMLALLIVLARSPVFFILVIIMIAIVGASDFGSDYILTFFFMLNTLKAHMGAPPDTAYWPMLLTFAQTLYVFMSKSTWFMSTGDSNGESSAAANFLESLNLQISGTECAANILSEPIIAFMSSMMFPVFLLALLFVVIIGNFFLYKYFPRFGYFIDLITPANIIIALKWVVAKLKELITKAKAVPPPVFTPNIVPAKTLKESIINGALLLLLWAYFNLSISIFKIIQPCSSENYMKLYPWISCEDSSTYTALIALASIFFIIYVAGIPALFIALVVRAQHKKILTEDFVQNTMGFLYASYKHQNPWVFLIFIARRVVISGLVAMISDRFWVNFGCILVLIIFLIIIFIFNPYKEDKANLYQVFEVLALIFTITCFQTLDYHIGLFAIVILINCAVGVLLIIQFVLFKLQPKPATTTTPTTPTTPTTTPTTPTTTPTPTTTTTIAVSTTNPTANNNDTNNNNDNNNDTNMNNGSSDHHYDSQEDEEAIEMEQVKLNNTK